MNLITVPKLIGTKLSPELYLFSMVNPDKVAKVTVYEGIKAMLYPYRIMFYQDADTVLATWSFTVEQEEIYLQIKKKLNG